MHLNAFTFVSSFGVFPYLAKASRLFSTPMTHQTDLLFYNNLLLKAEVFILNRGFFCTQYDFAFINSLALFFLFSLENHQNGKDLEKRPIQFIRSFCIRLVKTDIAAVYGILRKCLKSTRFFLQDSHKGMPVWWLF